MFDVLLFRSSSSLSRHLKDGINRKWCWIFVSHRSREEIVFTIYWPHNTQQLCSWFWFLLAHFLLFSRCFFLSTFWKEVKCTFWVIERRWIYIWIYILKPKERVCSFQAPGSARRYCRFGRWVTLVSVSCGWSRQMNCALGINAAEVFHSSSGPLWGDPISYECCSSSSSQLVENKCLGSYNGAPTLEQIN